MAAAVVVGRWVCVCVCVYVCVCVCVWGHPRQCSLKQIRRAIIVCRRNVRNESSCAAGMYGMNHRVPQECTEC